MTAMVMMMMMWCSADQGRVLEKWKGGNRAISYGECLIIIIVSIIVIIILIIISIVFDHWIGLHCIALDTHCTVSIHSLKSEKMDGEGNISLRLAEKQGLPDLAIGIPSL